MTHTVAAIDTLGKSRIHLIIHKVDHWVLLDFVFGILNKTYHGFYTE